MSDYEPKEKIISTLVENYVEFQDLCGTLADSCTHSMQAELVSKNVKLWLRAFSRSFITKIYGVGAIPHTLSEEFWFENE